MNGKRFSEDKARKNGFYLALAVCLTAVGIAAWSTYDAVHGYLTAERSEPAQMQVSQPAPSAAPDDPEAPRATASKPAQQTAGTVTAKPRSTPAPSPSPTPAPVTSKPEEKVRPAEEEFPEPMTPATAPLYEISTEMIWPLASQETAKPYSSGAPVYSETMKDWRIHAGADIAAQSGEGVLACGNGVVKEVYSDNMLGNVAVIEHGDYDFYYCGLGEELAVEPGETVAMGQAVGRITAVPSEAADPPHLHLEVRRDGARLDPISVIEGKN